MTAFKMAPRITDEPTPLLSIDPGYRGVGAALWSATGVLMIAQYVPGTKHQDGAGAWNAIVEAMGMKADVSFTQLDMVSEFPQIYIRDAKSAGNDLLMLAAVVGALSVFPKKTTLVLPREWKGQIPKPRGSEEYIITERVKKRLSEEENAAVKVQTSRKLSWDVYDAIGIGLFHLGRW